MAYAHNSAYEKGFTDATVNTKIYEDYWREGLLRAKRLNLPKAIKGLEPSAWQANRPTWLLLQQHTTQTMRRL